MSNDSKKTTDKLIPGHEYDGIQELDNPPPTWFNLLFIVTLVFGALYFAWYQMGPGPTQSQEYAALIEGEKAASQQAAGAAPAATVTEETLVGFSKDPARLASGKTVYTTKCAACHGAQGQGGIGPNLTDDHWIHGGKLTQVVKVITEGVGDKGMPPWGPLLSKEEIQSVAAFIRSIRGTNPPGAKAPQGQAESL